MAKSPGSISTPIRNLARLVTVSRVNYNRRISNETFNAAVARAKIDRMQPLTRKHVENIAAIIAEQEGSYLDTFPFSASDLVNLENGRSSLNNEKIFWILRGVGYTRSEAQHIIFIYSSVNAGGFSSGPNPNIAEAKDKEILVGSFGDLAYQRMYSVDPLHITPWVSCAIADKGGFREDEIFCRIDKHNSVKLPPELNKIAIQKKKEWDEARSANRMAPFNGPTLALSHYNVDNTESEGSGERNIIRLNLINSLYANNVAAKSSPEAEEIKWKYLSNLGTDADFQPCDFLASGVGIAVNVFCDGGRKIVIGQRSNLESFRPSEFDVAVVEGIRPDFNSYAENENAKYIDVYDVLRRGVLEELGIDLTDNRKCDLSIFEFGCDLKFYQWNFLASLILDMEFEEVVYRWSRAKSRRENNFLIALEANERTVRRFILTNPIWSCGIACLMESIRRTQREDQ